MASPAAAARTAGEGSPGGMAEHAGRLPGGDDSSKVLDLAADRVGSCIPACPPAPAVVGQDGEMRGRSQGQGTGQRRNRQPVGERAARSG
jgi:hypothetical protein